ncbi:unnamed protein product [Alopecurus aequalis]
MKLLKESIVVPNGPGSVELLPETHDDMWDAYNLILAGDTIEALTARRITSRDMERVSVVLEIAVVHVEYSNDKGGSVLRVRGKNLTKTEHVQVGQYHTIMLEPKKRFVLRKNLWDWPARHTLERSCDNDAADLPVLLMQEGLANLYLVGGSVATKKARVKMTIPRKHGDGAYDTALKEFFARVLDAFLNHVDLGLDQIAVFAGPGFTKDQFRDYMVAKDAGRRGDIKARIVLASASSAYRHSLKEVLGVASVMAQIKDTRAALEVPALQEFFTMIATDSDRACYGPKHVEVANERLAIRTLLLTDTWFRNPDVVARRKYVDLAESVRKLGGTVHVMSSMHVSGNHLEQLTGIAAVLRFPLPELDEIEM